MCGPHNGEFQYSVRYTFPITNNVVEYEVLLTGLDLAKKIRAQHVIVHVDSQFVIKQVTDKYETNIPFCFPITRKYKLSCLRLPVSKSEKSQKKKIQKLMPCPKL